MLDLQASLDERVCEVHHFEAEVRHWERRHSEELLKCEEKTDNAEQRIRELEVDLDAKGRELASVSGCVWPQNRCVWIQICD